MKMFKKVINVIRIIIYLFAFSMVIYIGDWRLNSLDKVY